MNGQFPPTANAPDSGNVQCEIHPPSAETQKYITSGQRFGDCVHFVSHPDRFACSWMYVTGLRDRDDDDDRRR